jgi:hypothetical protein
MMILRWTAAGVLEAEHHFRKVADYRGLIYDRNFAFTLANNLARGAGPVLRDFESTSLRQRVPISASSSRERDVWQVRCVKM